MINLNFTSRGDYFEQKKKVDKKLQPILILSCVGVILVSCISLYFSIFKNNASNYVHNQVDILYIIASTIFIIPAYSMYKAYTKGEADLWSLFAEKNNGIYKPFGYPQQEQSIMFRQGYNQIIKNVILLKNKKEEMMRIFSFSFMKKKIFNRNPSYYHFTVFDFEFQGLVPNIYLNYKNDRYSITLNKNVPLPKEFEKSFSASVPAGYEIEVLEIFTPDLLIKILDLNLCIDIELINHNIYFFIQQDQSFGRNFEKHLDVLQSNYKAVVDLMSILKPKLERFNFEKIGTKTTFL